MESITWTGIEQKYLVADNKLKNFFDALADGKVMSPNGVNITYRDSQEMFSLLVMKAIRDNEILLIEAGVGTGKSFGYLLPIFYTMGEVRTFDKILISTSSIALQEQLVNDINTINNLLNMDIKAEVSKGIVNYACLRNLEHAIDSARAHKKTNHLEVLLGVKKLMYNKGIYDKKDFSDEISPFWERIQVKGGCDKCDLRSHCEFIKHQARIGHADIIVTNHTQLSNMIKNNSDSLSSSKMLVIDEAHKLEEELRLSTERKFDLMSIWSKLNTIKDILYNSEDYDFSYELEVLKSIIPNSTDDNPFINLARALRSNGKYIFKTSNNSGVPLKEVEKLNININNKKVRDAVFDILNRLKPFTRLFKTIPNIPGLKVEIEYIQKSIGMFEDMYKGISSEYVYWIRFLNTYSDDIELVYTKKDMSDKCRTLYHGGKPIILTSATLTTNDNYDKIRKDLSLTCSRVEEEESITSPFDYSSNSLFYYDKTITSPTDENRSRYIADLAIKIKELIELTDGKALILFTSKNDMEEVYRLVQSMLPDRNLILQRDKNVTKWKNAFEVDVNSCLFATGAFWEGIDLKGETLSNLIIARLPFPVQDPIVEYKMSIYEGKKMDVTINEMLMKLKQGTGRLIRSTTDKGIVCCLDSRVPQYLNSIMRTLPFENYTDDMDDVIDFVNENIHNSSGESKILKFSEK